MNLGLSPQLAKQTTFAKLGPLANKEVAEVSIANLANRKIPDPN
jgi:hypothetical protein